MKSKRFKTAVLLIFIILQQGYAQTGLFLDFASNSSADFTGSNPTNFQIAAVSQELRIISTSAAYENVEFSFASINISANPVLTVRVRAGNNFNMRVDLKDAAGRYTNATPVVRAITGNNTYQLYTFNFAGNFTQSWPSTAAVDPTQIVQASFFFNPGAGYNGTIYFDDLTIGDAIPFVPAIPGKIMINQLGYELNGPKIAVFQSTVTSLSTDSFYIVNGTNQIVYRGLGVYKGAVTGWSNRYYWTLDFSSFIQSGTFKVKLKAGNNFSYSFQIAHNLLFNTLAPMTVTFFNGMRHTGASDNSLSFNGPRNDLVNVSGGWWDATGDPGKHMSHLSYANHFNPQQIPFVVWSLLKGYSLNPTAYSSFSTALLSEARWGADYIHKNIDPLGYLYLAVFDDWGNSPGTREICEWGQAPACDNCRTANYQAAMREGSGIAIAALAKAYQMNLSGGTFTPAQYLSKAELLYNHLKSPGTGYATKNLEYCNDHTENIIDFYCGLMAATELYKATSNAIYLTDAQNYATLLMARQQAGGWLTSNVANTRAYYHAADEGLPVHALIEYAQVNPSQSTAVSSFLTNWIDWYQGITAEVNNPFTYVREYGNPYASGALQPVRKAFFLPHANETGYWWQGENARIASMSSAFTAAYRFLGSSTFGNNTYSLMAVSQLDWILGKNPFDVCMMTGVGTTTYPTYLNGAKKPNVTGGICNGITSMNSDENNIDWAPYDQGGGDAWQNWRWIEQWLPHDAWFFMALAQLNYAMDVPLPIMFLGFDLSGLAENKVIGEWRISEEHSVLYYLIEKSLDGKNFFSIDTIIAENRGISHRYFFIDNMISETKCYYRISAIDHSGQKMQSEIKTFSSSNLTEIRCFPVPFADELHIQILNETKKGVLQLVNSNGVQMITKEIDSTDVFLDTASWPKGIYVLKLATEEEVRIIKIMK